MQNKIVISPNNKAAAEFFQDLKRKKTAIKQQVRNSAIVSAIRNTPKKPVGPK